MKITINDKTYNKIKNLNFAPEADITGTQVVINQFVVDIYTEDEIDVGVNAYLYDDMDKLWAKYWIVEAGKHGRNTIQVQAQSALTLLDRITLPVKMYSNQSASSAISEIFTKISAIYGESNIYSLDNSFAADTISGFAPEQSARDRFQWICFCIGAYVKSYFSDKIEIVPVDDNAEPIPTEKTYWKPSVTYGDYVTAVKVKAYKYTQGTPQTTDEWVQVGDVYYIQEEQEFTLSNPDVPITASDNEIGIKDLTLINTSNVSEIITRLSTYYFQRIEVDAEVINNGEYLAGRRYVLNTGDDYFVIGYVKSASFTFGLQAKSQIKLMQTETINGVELTIEYYYGNNKIYSNMYFLPVGYKYEIENPFIDYSMDGHRYIFYPNNDYSVGTVPVEASTQREDCSIAIDFYKNIAYIINVDEVEQSDEVVIIK